jgi:hypothetical protein
LWVTGAWLLTCPFHQFTFLPKGGQSNKSSPSPKYIMEVTSSLKLAKTWTHWVNIP